MSFTLLGFFLDYGESGTIEQSLDLGSKIKMLANGKHPRKTSPQHRDQLISG